MAFITPVVACDHGFGVRLTGWMGGPRAYRVENAKCGGEPTRKLLYFNGLSPPYFFVAVRSFGEYPAERAEIRPYDQSDSQELFAKKPANTGDFPRSDFGERALPKC